jgi:serine protease inhibitor
MMGRKGMKGALLITLVVPMLTLASCGIADRTDAGRAPGMAIASEKERAHPEVGSRDLRELVDGNTAFAFDPYRLPVEQQEGEIVFYSRYSISLALAMTYAGARGETEEQMAHALCFTLPAERLHPAFNALDQELAQRGKGSEGADEADLAASEGAPIEYRQCHLASREPRLPGCVSRHPGRGLQSGACVGKGVA